MNFRYSICVSAALAVLAGGCTQVRGRKRIQEANELYRRGKYTEAVALYEEAARLVPALPTLWLNEGYTCRQLIAPGGKDAESRRAAACALRAFRRLAELAPHDPRAAELTLATWSDIGDYPAIESTFLERNRRDPNDVDVVRGLQDVYYRWGKWPEALEWSKRAAALHPDDAEAQYGVGTFIWQILSARGGSSEMATYDPWPRSAPDSDGRPTVRPPPPFALNDVTGALRVELADQGIAYLGKALARRPRYPEAMTYLGLLWRQKSFGLYADPIAWQGAVDEADTWQQKALLARAGKS
ncbi:MAG TPA: tetratricopeptide repeat protein [Polyangia bacterium]|nr:tetratricopeptide repeat protein [Polyangia bacterium]